jgi:hypothetical protein
MAIDFSFVDMARYRSRGGAPQRCAPPILSTPITITGNSDHDRLEIVITILWDT